MNDGERRKITKKEKREALEALTILGIGEIIKRPVSIVIVEARDEKSGAEYVGVGWAKVRSPDAWVPERGRDVAKGKALHHIAQQIAGVRGADRFTISLASVVGEPIPF